MDQNQTLNSDLQKAIDDITNTTSIDPVFSDPVAAPSSVPEGDTGAMSEAIGPFPAPEPIAPDFTAATQSQTPVPMPELPPMPEINMPPMPAVGSMPPQAAPSYAEVSNMSSPELASSPEMPNTPEAPIVAEAAGTEQIPQNIRQVRESALRDLAPVLDRMTIEPSQKFRIYRDMLDELHDYSVIESAYQSAREIADEKERGEALLYLVESIDNM